MQSDIREVPFSKTDFKSIQVIFLVLQVWNMNEDDIKQLLPFLLKLGVIVDGAPKAGYEIELALSYFKNLSVTKRYHLPLFLKLPNDPPVSNMAI